MRRGFPKWGDVGVRLTGIELPLTRAETMAVLACRGSRNDGRTATVEGPSRDAELRLSDGHDSASRAVQHRG